MSTDTMFLIAEDEFISELNSECNDSKCCNIELISSIYISEYVVKNHMLTDVKFNNRTIEDRTIDNRIIDDRTIIDNGIKADIINKDTTAVVLFTAGTTEHSKGVVLTHGNLLRSAKNGCYINGTVFQMNYLALIPFTHVFGLVRNLLTSIYSQSTMFLCESMKYMIRDIQLAKPNILVLVPALAQMLYGIILSRGIEAVGGELTTIICGGAPVPEELIMNYQKIDIMIQPGYGLSEAAGMVCGNMEAAEYPLSVGVLFPDGEWKIVNQELYIRGDHVMHSYYGQNGIDENGWFHTGDLGYFDKEGRLYLTGRSKNVIITDNGYSVSPEEIETVVDKLPYVSASIATEGTDEIGNKIIVIHIVATKAAKEDYSKAQLQEMLQEDINKLNRIFPLHMQIRKIKLRDEDFMRNGSLKIIRRGLE